MAQNITLNWFATDNQLGDALTTLYDPVSPSTPEIPAPTIALGTEVTGNNGSRWIFVKANGPIQTGDLVQIDPQFNATRAAASGTGMASVVAGVAQFNPATINSASPATAAAGNFFWACRGAAAGLQVNFAATSGSVPIAVMISTTAGKAAAAATPGAGQSVNGMFQNTAVTVAGNVTAADVICNGVIRFV